MKSFISELPKGELHVHLNGLVSSGIIRNIITAEEISIPSNFDLEKDLNVFSPQKKLTEYLRAWQILRLIPKSRKALNKMVDNAFCNLSKQNISFVELRNSVIYIAKLNNISIEKALMWLISEIERASDHYNIKAGLILTIPRKWDAAKELDLLLNAYNKLGRPSVIVGVDLAGDENLPLPLEVPLLFTKIKEEYGLGITIHAGETGKESNIIEAVNNFRADRIGHGAAAGKSKEIMCFLKENDICIEVCPISNRLTGAIKEEEIHPVLEFIKNEVPFVICSDNPAIHNCNLNDDYYDFYTKTNRQDILSKMYDMQKKYSFIKNNI